MYIDMSEYKDDGLLTKFGRITVGKYMTQGLQYALGDDYADAEELFPFEIALHRLVARVGRELDSEYQNFLSKPVDFDSSIVILCDYLDEEEYDQAWIFYWNCVLQYNKFMADPGMRVDEETLERITWKQYVGVDEWGLPV